MLTTKIEAKSPLALHPWKGNSRTHSKKQIQQIAKSLQRFGFLNPVLVNDNDEILAGHARVEAAKLLGLESVPILRVSDLSRAELRAYVVADNKIALNAGWDRDLLALELRGLADVGIELELTGFGASEIEILLDPVNDGSGPTRPEDECPRLQDNAVTRRGDIWQLGAHRLLCGDPRGQEEVTRLIERLTPNLMFVDVPYAADQDRSDGLHVRHPDLGAIVSKDLPEFLGQTLRNAAWDMQDGAIAFVGLDPHHLGEVMTAGKQSLSELKDVCVWNKGVSASGSFYPAQHELVLVFKVGTAPAISNFASGKKRRQRTNVWDYPGVALPPPASHRTVKPVALVADAIKDCSRRGQIVVDPLGGFGTTLIAAEKTNRSARLMEFDPRYCDVIVRRFEKLTGQSAQLLKTNQRFDEVSRERLGAAIPMREVVDE